MSATIAKTPTPKARQHTARQGKRHTHLGGDLFRHPDATFDGKVHKGVDKQVAALPFVRSPKRERRTLFLAGQADWQV